MAVVNGVYRGDIFYVKSTGKPVCGSEQNQDRPAVIVSNNIGNEHSNIVEVVYVTSKEKNPLPTHVKVMCKVPSTALCEQISNISKERLGEYVRSCTDEEMAAIDRALMVSLGISNAPEPIVTIESAMLDDLKMKLEEKQCQIVELKAHIEKMEADAKEADTTDFALEGMKILVERDFYKQQYEMLLERLIAR